MRKSAFAAVLFNLCLFWGAAVSAAPAVSKVWPMSDEGTAWMIEGLPNSETIGYPVGEKAPARLPPDWHAVVEAPAYVELLSSTYSYSRPMPAPGVEDITRDGRAYKRYTFAHLDKRNAGRWASFFTHWVPRPGEVDRKTPGVFAWRFITPEGEEVEQTQAIKLLPELPEFKGPKRLQVRLWQGSILNCQPEKLKSVLTLLQRSGFNTMPVWESPLDNLKKAGVREMGLKISADQAGHNSWPDMKKPSPAPDYQNRDNEGRAVKHQDPQWIIDGNGEPWKNDLAFCKQHAVNLDVISQDSEMNISEFNTGFSPAGIRAFAKQNNLNAAELTPSIIWAKYRKQWYDFRSRQDLELARFFHNASKKSNPNVLTVYLPGSPYSTTNADLMSEMIQLEPDSLGRMQYLTFPFPVSRMHEAMDVVMPMWYGHGAPQVREGFSWSRAFSRAVVKPPLMALYLGQGREFYFPGGDSGEILRAMNLAAVMGGSKGYGYWLGEFSPLQLSWLARGGMEIAEVEDIFLDGKPDPACIAITPMPKNTFTLKSGTEKRTFPVPDFMASVIWRGFELGDQRLVALINLEQQHDAYFTLSVSGLNGGKARYRLIDVAENRIISGGPEVTYSAEQLKAGVLLRTPARYGVSLYLIEPASNAVSGTMKILPATDIATDYKSYKTPDTTGAVLAEKAGMSIRYDLTGKDQATAVLIETPAQQLWVRLEFGGRISDWKIKDGNRTLLNYVAPQPYGGATLDLFWSPAEAHWSGDEVAPYELVSAKIHGGKAYLQMRQKKKVASLQGLVVTKTIIVPVDRTDIEVKLDIENEGPAPVLGFAAWQNNVFQFGNDALEKSSPRQHPQIFMQTAAGVTEAPMKEIMWATSGAAYMSGNEPWEKKMRDVVTTGDWIAQRNPVTGEAVLCQVRAPAVAQFYSWRNVNNPDELSVEWMTPCLQLQAGRTWSTNYVLRYVKFIEPKKIAGKLKQ